MEILLIALVQVVEEVWVTDMTGSGAFRSGKGGGWKNEDRQKWRMDNEKNKAVT